MFLIERMLGVALYSLLLFLVFILLKPRLNSKSVKRILNIYLFFLCVMAFSFVPNEGSDLYRILQITRNWNQYSFVEFIQVRVINSATPVAELMIYFCGFLENDGWLPAFSCFIFFNNYFYILKDLNKRHEVNSSVLAYSMMFFMSTGVFLEVISGVRCFTALSIIARCCYDELYNEGKMIKSLPFALFASLMHSMALVVYYLWIIYSMGRRKQSRAKKMMSILGVMSVGSLLLFVGKTYIETAMNKAVSYLNGEKSFSYFWEYCIGWMVIFVLILILWKNKKIHKLIHESNLYIFNIFLIAIECVIAFEYNTFHRLITMSLLMSVPMVCKYLDINNDKAVLRKNNILIISILILLLSCVRGNLSSYKFFVI